MIPTRNVLPAAARQLLTACAVAALVTAGLGSGASLASSAPPNSTKTRQAVGNWWDRTEPGKGKKLTQSKYYTIRSDLPAEETVAWGKQLDTMYEEYTRRLVQGGGMRRRTPEFLNVMLFARQQDYLDTMRTHFGLNAMGSGGMFFVTGRGGGLALFTENLSRQRVAHVAQHEGFHQFAHAFFGNDLPPWLNEGLAEFFGYSVVEGKLVVTGQAPPDVLEVVRKSVNAGKNLPFSELLQMDHGQWNGNVQLGNAAQQYHQSWSMVHFLVYGEGGKYQGAFQRMLQMVNAGTRPYEAMRMAFGLTTDADVRDFESKWKAHIKNATPSSYIAARMHLEFLAEGMRTVWDRGQRPRTMQELRAMLQDEKFQYPLGTHGYTMMLSAADESNFTVPQDPANKTSIALELVPSPEPRTAAAKKLEEQRPTPPIIRTRGMEPKDVLVQWKRRPDSPQEFDYELVAQ